MWDKRHQKQSFVRSGHIDLTHGSLTRFGFHGYDWSNTAFSYTSPANARAGYLYLNAKETRPNDYYYHYRGFPVRCLVY